MLCIVVVSFRPGSNVVQDYSSRFQTSRQEPAVAPSTHSGESSFENYELEGTIYNDTRIGVLDDERQSIAQPSDDAPGEVPPPTPVVAPAAPEPVVTQAPPLPDPVPTRSAHHTRYITLATMLKNKRPWLREWIEFNLLIGVEHLIIYDNYSTDHPLEILQYYINAGYVTYVPWPPQEIPVFLEPKTQLEEWQYSWMNDTLATCLDDTFTIHKQGPCQMAAFLDAIWKTNNGVSRWLGVWDIDEFIFPREHSGYRTLDSLLRAEFADYTHLEFQGSVFGTSGHIHAPQRKEGSILPALITEEYSYRAELDRMFFYEFANFRSRGRSVSQCWSRWLGGSWKRPTGKLSVCGWR